jgi:hypothetical protein
LVFIEDGGEEGGVVDMCGWVFLHGVEGVLDSRKGFGRFREEEGSAGFEGDSNMDLAVFFGVEAAEGLVLGEAGVKPALEGGLSQKVHSSGTTMRT